MATTAARVTEETTASAPDLATAWRAAPGSQEAARRAAELFQRHRRMVEGLCRGLLRDRVEAEDAAQQTFLSAHRGLLGGSEPREPAAWLAAIARNECLARIRARMREPLTTDAEAASTGGDPLEEAIRRADFDAVWVAVSALPPQQRRALLLREFGGLSYDELALALGVSAPAVESLLFRARTRLRAQLETAFAGLSGAGWISALQDAFARLLASGGADKLGAPLAAKTIGATLGVAALAGGAVVGEQHTRSRHPRHRAPAPAVVTAVVPRLATAGASRAASSLDSRGESGRSSHARSDGTSSSGRGSSDGGSGERNAGDRRGSGESVNRSGHGEGGSDSSGQSSGGPVAPPSSSDDGAVAAPSGSSPGSGPGSAPSSEGGGSSGGSGDAADPSNSSGSGSSEDGSTSTSSVQVATTGSSGDGGGGDGGHGGSSDGGSSDGGSGGGDSSSHG